MDYVGQVFGLREVVCNYCLEEDWTKIGLNIPSRTDRYYLTKCLNCGKILPTSKRNLINSPPKRCVFCSNIGNHSNIKTNTNQWTLYDDYAVCNVMYNNKIISFYIDAEDYDKTKEKVWRISQKKQKYYVISGSYKKNTMIYLHEFILGNRIPGTEIDHLDGNSLNNRKSNLRQVSRQDNIDNQRATRIDNQIGIRGIAYNKRNKRYKVDFNYHGVRYYTTDWKTLEEAVWCRKCFEDYFNLPAIKNNPLAEQYYTLSPKRENEIQEYVHNIILRNER